MKRLTILASMITLAVGTANCGNSPGQANSLIGVGPSATIAGSSDAGAGNLTTLGKGGSGKPGGGGTTSGGGGTISLVLLNSTDGQAHFGQDVTFNVSTTATTKPWVSVRCYQGGTLVEKDSNGMFAGSLDEIFTLGGSPAWQSGDADCTATLENWDNYSKNGSITALTSISFHVYQ
jgi:hypothetical protein